MNINFFKSHKIKIHRPIIWIVSLFFLLTITLLLVYAAENTYNFDGVTSPSSGDIAYEEYPEDGFSGPTDQGEGEAAQGDYDNIESNNGVRWETAGADVINEYDSQLYQFFVDESESAISQLDFKWNGYGEIESGYNTTLYAYDYDGTQWIQLSQVDFTAATDQDLTHAESADPGKFIDTDGEVTLMVKTKKYLGSESNYCSDGLDNDDDGWIDGCDADCGGGEICSSGTCCDTSTCNYKAAGQQGCAACTACTGSSATCQNVSECEDCYGCTGSCSWCYQGSCKSCTWSYIDTLLWPGAYGSQLRCKPSRNGAYGYVEGAGSGGCTGNLYNSYYPGGSGTCNQYQCSCP